MSCLVTCIQPSPSNAHCSACHETFGSVSGFDRHRRAGECLDVRQLAMHRDRNGVWRMAAPDPTVRTVWPQRTEVVISKATKASSDGGWNWRRTNDGGWVSA